MNGRTAKILRGKMQFHPGAEREYQRVWPGIIRATGARRSYQAVKRNPVLRTAVLRAA